MSDSENETQQQKRLRLTKATLKRLEQKDELNVGFDAQDLDREIIASRIQEYIQPVKYIYVKDFKVLSQKTIKLHEIPTCICYSKNRLYMGTKDCSIITFHFDTNTKNIHRGEMKQTQKWIAKVGKQELEGHWDSILSMDISFDSKFLVTSGLDKRIIVWNPETMEKLNEFTQHRDAVTGVKFRIDAHDLYSCSFDRTIKVWNIQEMTYVETLFGHQDQISCLHTLAKEQCLTTGTRDRTVRLWKIPQESQLVFRGGGGLQVHQDLVVMHELTQTDKKRLRDDGLSGGCIDACVFLDDNLFVSGTDSGSLSLWSTTKKKPIYTKLKSHGSGSVILGDEAKYVEESVECNWITALHALPYTDSFASASGDGYIRLWKLSQEKKSFTLVNTIPVQGIVNQLLFFIKDDHVWLAACVGRETRYGRWFKVKTKNRIELYDLGPLQ